MNERDYKISVIVIVRVELFFFSLLSITCPCFKLPGRNLPPFSKMGKFLPGRLIPIRYVLEDTRYNVAIGFAYKSDSKPQLNPHHPPTPS